MTDSEPDSDCSDSVESSHVEFGNSDVVVIPNPTAYHLRMFLRYNPDVVYDEYRPEQSNASVEQRSLQGSCYVLSEAWFHAMGGVESPLEIYCLSWSDVGCPEAGTHWFLRDTDRDRVVDISLDSPSQAADIPYGSATRRAFITGYERSNRCQRVLEQSPLLL